MTVLEEGPSDGPEAGEGDIVEVYYVGVLSADGTEFDSNYGTGTPLASTLGAGDRIPGWDQGLRGVRPGDRVQIDMPSELGYGEAGSQGGIPPDSALTFVMDIVSVTDLPTEAPTELEVTVLEEGPSDGPEAKKYDTVNVYSQGYVVPGGTQIENNVGSGTPRPVVIGQAPIEGLGEALTGAQPGDRLQVAIPSELAYGATGSQEQGIPPDAALFYVIDVVEVVSPPEFELPEEAPEEVVRTVLSEGDADGRVRPALRHRRRPPPRRHSRRTSRCLPARSARVTRSPCRSARRRRSGACTTASSEHAQATSSSSTFRPTRPSARPGRATGVFHRTPR